MSRIQITYGTTPGPQHGGNGGSLNFFNLEANEFIVEVQGRADARLDCTLMGVYTLCLQFL